MSGRIRTIKPELLEDAKTARLSDAAWRTFVSLLLLADDHGNLHADPDRIEASLFWGSREPRESVASILETLETLSLLEKYEVRGQSYIHLSGWARHQKVDKPSRPRVPTPCDASRESVANPSRDTRERSPISDLRSPITDLRARDRARTRSAASPPSESGQGRESGIRDAAPSERPPEPLEQEEQLYDPRQLAELFAEVWKRLRNVSPPLPAELAQRELMLRVVETAELRSVAPLPLFTSALESWASGELNERERRAPWQCFAQAFGEVVDRVLSQSATETASLSMQSAEALERGDYEAYSKLQQQARELETQKGARHGASAASR